MARILKIGTLEWFHENERCRFKGFGSSKVMNSLFRRLKSDRACSQTDFRAGSLYSPDNDESEGATSHHFNLMRKSRRLLSVDPLDFNLGTENTAATLPTLLQNSDTKEQVTLSSDSVNEEDWPRSCQQILENGTLGVEMRDMLQISQRSLYKPTGSTSYHLHRELFYSQDNSEDDDESETNIVYSPSLHREPSPDEVPPQIFELNRRMSAIETILSRLEQKITLPMIGGSVEEVEPNEDDLSPADLEELELRKKLDELTERISDKGLSSEEEDTMHSPENSPMKESIYQGSPLRRASTPSGDFRHEWPVEAKWKSNMMAYKSLGKQKRVSSFDFSSTTSSELLQLEGKVAMAAASVQSTQSGDSPTRMLPESPIRGRKDAKSLQKLMTM
ncbi:hypothetical protein DNTS_005430 [Danionella cerebrum]|uniref:Uncharacterized protein n=1 Tax=Danionella cerebrum TaxID=2873325 RepID=A0A553RKP3_9TELE|nr:hypothetical protein DNTS_005430 [Danionella translucida]